MSNPNIQTRPLNEWQAGTPNGDIALCDPFDGQPLCGELLPGLPHIGLEPKRPTPAFVATRLGNGYGFWKGSKRFDVPPIVSVFLTDPSRPDGLGDYEDFCDLASNFDVVVRRDTRSTLMERKARLAGAAAGTIAVRHGVEVNSAYDAQLTESHNNIVNLAHLTDAYDNLITDGTEALRAVRDTAVLQAEFEQRDPNDPDLTAMVADLVTENTQQWHDVMAAGLVGDQYYLRHGRPMTSMLYVAPFEAADSGRKFVVSGVPQELNFQTEQGPMTVDNVEVGFALPEMIENSDMRTYAMALDHGYIPHEALRGAQY